VRQVFKKVDGAVAAADHFCHQVAQRQEFGVTEAAEQRVVHRLLQGRQPDQEASCLIRRAQLDAPPVALFKRFLEQPHIKKRVLLQRQEGAAEMQVFGHLVDADVLGAVLVVVDGDQDRVLAAGQSDMGAKAVPDFLHPSGDRQHVVHETSEYRIGVIRQELWLGYGERTDLSASLNDCFFAFG
jgi:hypothetical protein